jgi:hypothetical protein
MSFLRPSAVTCSGRRGAFFATSLPTENNTIDDAYCKKEGLYMSSLCWREMMHDDDDAAVMTMMTPKQDASAYDDGE